jgi:hypothetical protein
MSSMGGGWKFINKDHSPEDAKSPATKHGK